MCSSDPESNVLFSGNDGVYDVSFFAASIGHTIDQSRSVFERLTGGQLSDFREAWRGMSADDRRAYLLEQHEFAHHALMFSTPAGVLNWRINQIISRDIQWILRKCADYGVSFPSGTPPRTVLSKREWQVAFKRRADVDRAIKRELLHTICSLEDLFQLRRIFFEPGAAARFPDLTFAGLLPLLRRSFAYMQDRCEIPFQTDWRTNLPLSTKVFPSDKSFNVVDIAEVHAIAMELFVLRALDDIDAMRQRAERAREGAYGAAVGQAVAQTSAANDLGFSPHQMQLMSLIALSSRLDTRDSSSKGVYLEDALPWWRFASGTLFTARTYSDALANCLGVATSPLIGQGSRWLQLPEGDWPLAGGVSISSLGALCMGLSSLGLDRQIHAIHEGADLNWRYLASQLEETFGSSDAPEFERLSPEAWRGQLQIAVLLVEYRDDFHFRQADYKELYPAGGQMRSSVPALDHYGQPQYQLIGQLLNGAIPRTMYASYTGRLLPGVEIFKDKLAKHFSSSSIGESIVSLLKAIVEGRMSVAAPFLTIAPPSISPDRYI